MEEARFTMRIHPVVMNKMKRIAKDNGRSLNKEIEQILKWVVDDYERKYGRIKLTPEEIPSFAEKEVHPVQEQNMEGLFKLDR
ncbi:MAG: Arc family DNA-binding protein [Acidaminococcaceae bacterium]|nr:Arc family DNA-binding protein [Acidaminococcaceae bacterium]